MSGDGETAGEVFMSTKKTGTETSRETPKTGLKQVVEVFEVSAWLTEKTEPGCLLELRHNVKH